MIKKGRLENCYPHNIHGFNPQWLISQGLVDGELSPIHRWYVKEDKGVRVWGYGGTVYKKLLSLVLNPDYGDITDTEEGTDLTISYSTKTGRMFAETDVAPRRKTSTLCSKAIGGAVRCAELLDNMPAFDTLFERLTAQQITNLLDEFLSDQNGAGPEIQKYNADTGSEDDLLNSVFREISAGSK